MMSMKGKLMTQLLNFTPCVFDAGKLHFDMFVHRENQKLRYPNVYALYLYSIGPWMLILYLIVFGIIDSVSNCFHNHGFSI